MNMILIMDSFRRVGWILWLHLLCTFVLDGSPRKLEVNDTVDDINDYPLSIPTVSMRQYKDKKSGKLHFVTSGRLGLLGAVPSHICDLGSLRSRSEQKFSRSDVKRILQCARSEPDLDEHSGALSMMSRMPLMRETLEIAAAYGETHCWNWMQCKEVVKRFKEGKFDRNSFGMDQYNGFQQFRMFRILNNTLYDDWPFQPISRADKSLSDYPDGFLFKNLALFEFLAAKIYDLPDVVFFMGLEQAYLPWNIPVPAFSTISKYEFNQIPWPWPEAIRDAYRVYVHATEQKIDIQNATAMQDITSELLWNDKIPKAAYFGSWNEIRQFAFDAAAAEPELFDSSFSIPESVKVSPLNPVSKEEPTSKEDWLGYLKKGSKYKKNDIESAPSTFNPEIPGSAWPLFNLSDSRSYHPGHYKYVVVMLAMGGVATSGRVAELMAHSGAVILLQESAMHHHFTSRMVPWVHYVPVSYSGADLIRKVKWLHSHDTEARKLAENARTFARSYLRLEDYYCYALHSIEAISKVLGPDANIPFKARLISERNCAI